MLHDTNYTIESNATYLLNNSKLATPVTYACDAEPVYQSNRAFDNVTDSFRCSPDNLISFYRANAKRGIAVVSHSFVRLSVCPSVCNVDVPW